MSTHDFVFTDLAANGYVISNGTAAPDAKRRSFPMTAPKDFDVAKLLRTFRQYGLGVKNSKAHLTEKDIFQVKMTVSSSPTIPVSIS